jgi:lipopolysaccharide export system protein LptC
MESMAFQGGAMAAGFDSPEQAAALIGRAGARRLAVAPPPDRERAFLTARRRSARVRFLRKAILIGATGTVAAMVAIAIFNPFSTKFGSLSFSALSVDGTKIAMARPRLAGFRADGQPYSLTAERALQDIKRPTIVELEKVNGEIGMAGGEATRISADAGVYDSVSQNMQLSKNIRIGNDRFEVRLKTADIDFKSGVYQSDEPVEVHVGEGTTIFGDRASAKNNGAELVFEGHVRTRIVPQSEAAADVKSTNP